MGMKKENTKRRKEGEGGISERKKTEKGNCSADEALVR